MSTPIGTGTRLATDVQPEVGRETVWEIDPKHSLVEFTVKHMMFSRVKGRFSVARGTIHCADESDPTRSTVEAELDAASIDTGDAQRDAHLRSADFLDADTYPTITFRSTRIERASGDQLRLVGKLTMRDTTREVVLETTFNGRGKNPYGLEVAGFSAETEINRRDFGLQWNVALESGGLLVGDKVEVATEVQAIKQTSS